MSGRKVELDEVIVPYPELENSSSLKSVPVIPTPISEEANDDDHETSDQVTTEPRRSSKVQLRRSDTPLPCGVPGGVSCETIPHCFK